MYTISNNLDSSKLHLNYRLGDIQNEVEKRTSYLGKFRKTEQSQHLLDLLAMTKDEENLFSPYANEAMADVFEELKKGMINLPYCSYEYKETIVKEIQLNPSIKVMPKNIIGTHTNDIVYINGYLTSTPIDTNKYGITIDLSVECKTECHTLDFADVQFVKSQTIVCTIPSDAITLEEGVWVVKNYPVYVSLEKESSFTSAETIVEVTNVKYIQNSARAFELEETPLMQGDVVKVNGKYFEITTNTDINNINLNTQAKPLDALDVCDGVHFYATIPSNVDYNHIRPLDNAIFEALVNKIILKWLIMVYPEAAEPFAIQDAKSTELVYKRCNIFNQRCNRTPRIF
jgi:hypothetical protein